VNSYNFGGVRIKSSSFDMIKYIFICTELGVFSIIDIDSMFENPKIE